MTQCAKISKEDLVDQAKTRCGWCAMKIGSFPLQCAQVLQFLD